MGYFDALLRYFEFAGRTSRGQYWMFQLLYGVLGVGAILGDMQLTGRPFDRHAPGLLVTFVGIFHLIPSISVTVRRLHDIGKSGWWVLLCVVPLGALWILVWTCYRSEAGANDYVDDLHGSVPSQPKAAAGKPAPVFRRSPTGMAAQEMLARMEARRGGARLAP